MIVICSGIEGCRHKEECYHCKPHKHILTCDMKCYKGHYCVPYIEEIEFIEVDEMTV